LNTENESFNRLISSTEAERLLSLHGGQLAKWRSARRKGQPPFVKLAARCVRYRLHDLEAWVESRRVELK
jgi:predicted DNA-binding transcriptional regulator AlpA